MNQQNSFYELIPDQVMSAVESFGYQPTGEYTQLNSYENRVFDIRLEPTQQTEDLHHRVIAKFYRPGRWSLEAIKEEHDFLSQLNLTGVPAVAPLFNKENETVITHNGLYTSFFPKAFGRMPQELSSDSLKRIGRSLAQLHNIGEQHRSSHRPTMTAETYGYENLEITKDWIAPEVRDRYLNAAEEILSFLDDELQPQHFFRIHGDCHKGNLLLTDYKDRPQEFFFVDFDDFCTGPVAQDFWMLFSDEEEQKAELDDLLSGYEELRSFDDDQLRLFNPLRGLRIIHYAAWIAKRWEDPSFPRIFPQYESYSYWADETEALERIAWSL